jgi:methylene-tetrahydromethanopterin dehydrogenase
MTGIFIGGRDIGLAIDMLQATKPAMMAPFEVSVFADPSGAFTTAAALVACVEKALNQTHGKELKDCKALVFGGTGPVGIATGIIASLQGAETVLVDHLSADSANDAVKQYNRRFGARMTGAAARTDADKVELLADADIVFCTAKAGIRVLSAAVLAQTQKLKVAGDVNAVPPAGIEGIDSKDMAAPLIHAKQSPNAVGVGALAVGNVKYKLQHELLKSMLASEKPVFIDFIEAFSKAQGLV